MLANSAMAAASQQKGGAYFSILVADALCSYGLQLRPMVATSCNVMSTLDICRHD